MCAVATPCHLLRQHLQDYIEEMGTLHISMKTVAGIVLGVVAFGAATGAAFAAWIDNDAGIFRAMVEAGLSWCM